MVDSISGKSNPIQDTGLNGVAQQQASQSVEKVNVEAAHAASETATLQFTDEATISDAAKKAYESDKEVMRFSRLAQRVKAPYDSEKVSQLKNLVDSGRINEYLRGINTETLADSLLNSPSGSLFTA